MIITLLIVVVLGGLALLVVSENPNAVTISVAYLENTASLGTAIVAAFGIGIVTGLMASFSRELTGSGPDGD